MGGKIILSFTNFHFIQFVSCCLSEISDTIPFANWLQSHFSVCPTLTSQMLLLWIAIPCLEKMPPFQWLSKFMQIKRFGIHNRFKLYHRLSRMYDCDSHTGTKIIRVYWFIFHISRVISYRRQSAPVCVQRFLFVCLFLFCFCFIWCLRSSSTMGETHRCTTGQHMQFYLLCFCTMLGKRRNVALGYIDHLLRTIYDMIRFRNIENADVWKVNRRTLWIDNCFVHSNPTSLLTAVQILVYIQWV